MLDKRLTIAQRQLSALGLTTGKVWLRLILPKIKHDDNATIDQIRRDLGMGKILPGSSYPLGAIKYRLNLDNLDITSEGTKKTGEDYSFENSKGFFNDVDRYKYGTYFVTGQGGNENEEITFCPALFYECDFDSIEDQYSKLYAIEAELGRKATLVVHTGGKSIHVYFRIAGGVPVEQFETYQRRLAIKQSSDQSVVNPARVMRLAGFNHYSVKDGKLISKAAEIIQENSNEFTLEEFDRLLPALPIESPIAHSYDYDPQKAEDTRDFILRTAKHLKGYSEARRNGWATAKCPCNTGVSNDSIHFNLGSGKWESHHGSKCDGKFIWQKLSEIASQVGIENPLEFKKDWIERDEFIKSLETPIANKSDSKVLALTISAPTDGSQTIKADADKLKGFTNATYKKVLKKAILKSHAEHLFIAGLWAEAETLKQLISLAQSLRIDFSLSIEGQTVELEAFEKEVFTRKFDALIKAEGERLSKLTYEPTIRVNQEYLPEFKTLDLLKQLIAVSSATGSGKTERVKDLMGLTLKINPERQVYNLSYRNALSMDTAQRLGLSHLHTVGKDFYKAKAKSCCVDSIHKLDLALIERGDLVIIDEVEAFINHLVNGSTCKPKRGEILRTFISFIQMVIRKGGFVVIMEADLTDVSIDFFRSIIGESVGMELIVNEYETIRYPITFLKAKKSHSVISQMKQALENGEKFLFVSNSQKECERVHRVLAKVYSVAMFRIDGKTSETEEVKAVLANLNHEIEKQDFHVLILSPSLESGGNIKDEFRRFDKVFGSFLNTDLRRVIQMLNRLRTDAPRIVFASANKQISLDSHTLSVAAMKAALLSNEQETERVCQMTKLENPKDLAFDLAKAEGSNWLKSLPSVAKADSSSELGFVLDAAIKLQVRSNCSMVRLDRDLEDRFARLGFDVAFDEVEECPIVKFEVKEANEETKENHLNECDLAGHDLPVDEAKEILSSASAKREDRLKAKQSLDYQRYNGEVTFTREVLDFLYVRNEGKNVKKLRFLVRMQNLEKSLVKEKKYREHTKGQLLSDKNHEHIRVKFAVEELCFLELMNADEPFNNESEIVKKVFTLAKQNAALVKQYFGLTITEQTTAIQFVQRFSSKVLGLKLQSKRFGGRKDQAYFYWFDLAVDTAYYTIWQSETKLIKKERYSPKPTKAVEVIEPAQVEAEVYQLTLVA